MLAFLLLATVCGVPGMLQNDQYLKDQFSTVIKQNENCEICFGTDCLLTDEARCKYYRRTENILRNGLDHSESGVTAVKNEIDEYLMTYVQEGSWTNQECIPLVSQYTNCFRENICIGCQTCNCDGMGRWNCTLMERCESDTMVKLNHMTLAVATEKLKYNLKGFQDKKVKRSAVYDNQPDTVSYEDILKHLFEIEHTNNYNKIDPTKENIASNDNGAQKDTDDSYIWDAESLRFAELPNSIDLDDIPQVKTKDYQKKSEVINLNTTDPEKILKNNSTRMNNGREDDMYGKSIQTPTLQFLNKCDNKTTRNLKKRESILDAQHSQNNASMISDHSFRNIKELKASVLYPLYDVVNEKQEELENLIKIEEKLVMFFKSFTEVNIENNASNSLDQNENLHLYFYQLEVPLTITNETRKGDINTMEKYLKTLKSDLLDVIRDIVNIQSLSNSSAMPQDLNVLTRVINHYVKKGNRRINIIGENPPINIYLRRLHDEDPYSKTSNPQYIINNIFKTLENNVSVNNALKPVSQKAKQIIVRIINQLYTEDLNSSSKVFDFKYDVTNVLIDMGKRWDADIASIIKIPLSNTLYCMKLLHLEVLRDIDKMKQILVLLNTENRRTVLIEDSVANKIISNIGNDLKRLNQQITKLNTLLHKKKYVMLKYKSPPSVTSSIKSKKKRKSFLKTIKRLLKNTKKDIRDLFHKKVPKKVDEDEATQRWHSHLDVRNKRAAGQLGNFFNRLKNIIPQYLRGKVKSVHKKKSYKTKADGKKGHRMNKSTKAIRK